MREPGTLTRGRDTKGRINALIEDLGLSQVTLLLPLLLLPLLLPLPLLPPLR